MDRISSTQHIQGIPRLRENTTRTHVGKDRRGKLITRQPSGPIPTPNPAAIATSGKKGKIKRSVTIVDPKENSNTPLPRSPRIASTVVQAAINQTSSSLKMSSTPPKLSKESLSNPLLNPSMPSSMDRASSSSGIDAPKPSIEDLPQAPSPASTEPQPIEEPIKDRKDSSELLLEQDSPRDIPTHHVQLTENGRILLPPKPESKQNAVAKRLQLPATSVSVEEEKEPFIEDSSNDILKTAKFLEINDSDPNHPIVRIWLPKKIKTHEMQKVIDLIIENLSKISKYLQQEYNNQNTETLRMLQSIKQFLSWATHWVTELKKKENAEMREALASTRKFFSEIKVFLQKDNKEEAVKLIELVTQFLDQLEDPLLKYSIQTVKQKQAIGLISFVLTVQVHYSYTEQWVTDFSDTRIRFNDISCVQKIRGQTEVRIEFYTEKGLKQFEIYFLSIFFPSQHFSYTSFSQPPNYYLLVQENLVQENLAQKNIIPQKKLIWEAIISLKDKLHPSIDNKIHYLDKSPYQDFSAEVAAAIVKRDLQKKQGFSQKK